MGKPIPELMSPELLAGNAAVAREGAKTGASPSAKFPKTTYASGPKMAFGARRTSYAGRFPGCISIELIVTFNLPLISE